MASKRIEVVLSDREPLQREILQTLCGITHSGGKTEFLRRNALRGLAALQQRFSAAPMDGGGSVDHIACALLLDEDYRLFSTFLSLQTSRPPPATQQSSGAPRRAVVEAVSPAATVAPAPSARSEKVRTVPSSSSREDAPADWTRFKKMAGVRQKGTDDA